MLLKVFSLLVEQSIFLEYDNCLRHWTARGLCWVDSRSPGTVPPYESSASLRFWVLYNGFTSCQIRYVRVRYLPIRLAAHWKSPKLGTLGGASLKEREMYYRIFLSRAIKGIFSVPDRKKYLANVLRTRRSEFDKSRNLLLPDRSVSTCIKEPTSWSNLGWVIHNTGAYGWTTSNASNGTSNKRNYVISF